MLIPIVGGSGTGKTTAMLQQIRELARKGESVLLLVPEQFSFEMERRITREIEPQAAVHVQVMSFTRLCHRVFMAYGGGAGQRVTEPAKRMLIDLTLDLVKDQLILYRRAAASAGFIESVLQMIEQFKTAGISPEMLQDFASLSGDEKLRQKTSELFLIYGVYQSKIDSGFIDDRDDLMRCAQLLKGKNHFKDTVVFIDSFRDFTPAERDVVKVIMQSCKDIYLSVLSKNLSVKGKDSDSQEADIFSISKENALHIIADAKEQGISVAAPRMLREPFRYRHEELRHLEDMMCSIKKVPFDGECSAIEVYAAKDPYEELRYTAARIAHLVKNEGFRYGDITIIARSLEPYESMMEHMFARYDIPIFWDKRQDIQSVPVVSGLLEALEASVSNFDTEHVLTLAKNPMLGLPYTDVLLLENYCYVWSIQKEQWLMKFENHPKGLVADFTEQDKETLDIINRTAQAVIGPLKTLSQKLKTCNGLEFARAVYEYLEDIGARENLRAVYAKEGLFYERVLQENDEAWNALMDLLDTMASILSDFTLTQQRFLELFRMGIICSDFGSIPNTLDQVAVGTADRIRPNEPKAVFILGMNQGEFPPAIREKSFFSDTEREEMAEAGIRISPTAVRQNSYEQMYLYSAMTAASDRLYISWHQSLIHGEEASPSHVIRELTTLFGEKIQKRKSDLPELFFAVNENTAFDELCRQYRQDNEATASLDQFLQKGEKAESLTRLHSVQEKREFVIQSRDIARMLFGENMRLSPSRIEKYFSCPFAYFCSAGLGLRARRKVDFSAMEAGSVIHYVLEKMVSRYGGRGLSELDHKRLETESMEVLKEYLHSRISQEEMLTKRFQYLYRNLAQQLARLLEQLAREFSQSEFEPCAFELPISAKSEVRPVVFETADGVRISVEGIVDRVDLMEKDGTRYVRVVDYKSGGKLFQLDDVYYGLNLQMLLYLFSIWENGKGDFANVLPGGVLYMPAKDPVVSVARQADDKTILQEKMKKYKMNGLILEDPVCIEGMEREMAGVYIPAKLKADGTLDARSSVASLAQMGQIRDHIQRLLEEMGSSLIQGHIEAEPSQNKTFSPCQYCDFRSICQHQQDDACRTMDPLGRAGFFDRLRKEEQEDER